MALSCPSTRWIWKLLRDFSEVFSKLMCSTAPWMNMTSPTPISAGCMSSLICSGVYGVCFWRSLCITGREGRGEKVYCVCACERVCVSARLSYLALSLYTGTIA